MPLFILAIFSSLLVVLFKFLQWNIIEIVSPFLMPFLWLLIYGFFLGVTIMTINGYFMTRQWKPVFIQVITVLLLFFFPINKFVLDLDFKRNKSEREEVIAMVEKDFLKPNVSHNGALILLPKKYRNLSKGGGEIIVEDSGVFFFTFRGILDGFSGFVYTPTDKKPKQGDFGGDFKEMEKLDENWYFVGSY